MLKLFLLFTTIPLLELWILFQISLRTGILPTIALVIVTGVVGASLARWQGVITLQKMSAELAQGRMPTDQLIDGALILVAGAVLLTPGIITDVFGFLLLIPPCRAVAKKLAVAYFKKHWRVVHFRQGSVVVDVQGGAVNPQPSHERMDHDTPSGKVIDVTPEQES